MYTLSEIKLKLLGPEPMPKPVLQPMPKPKAPGLEVFEAEGLTRKDWYNYMEGLGTLSVVMMDLTRPGVFPDTDQAAKENKDKVRCSFSFTSVNQLAAMGGRTGVGYHVDGNRLLADQILKRPKSRRYEGAGTYVPHIPVMLLSELETALERYKKEMVRDREPDIEAVEDACTLLVNAFDKMSLRQRENFIVQQGELLAEIETEILSIKEHMRNQADNQQQEADTDDTVIQLDQVASALNTGDRGATPVIGVFTLPGSSMTREPA